MKKMFGKTNCVPMSRYYLNKIIIDLDGNSYSQRFTRLLLNSGSVVFKIGIFEDVGTFGAD